MELLQQRLVLLVRHLLDQQLHGDQHADVYVTCGDLPTKAQASSNGSGDDGSECDRQENQTT